MRVIVIGLGVQGRKRQRALGADFSASIDPVNPEANYRTIEEVPLASYDAAIVCTPDDPKIRLLTYLLSNRKHALVEKPLFGSDADIARIEALANRNTVVCMTAYNHRFEPHFVRMRDLVASGELGRVYRCRMFYGNGTAHLVKTSAWRDQGAGVLPDLGSHLLDTARFWFGPLSETWSVVSAKRFENASPDHVVLASHETTPQLELEMTYLSWRNHFTCDVFAERGSAHIRSLCKWGPSTFTFRRRVLPSGTPPEETISLTRADPTWELEYDHFVERCEVRTPTSLENDRWLSRVIEHLSESALRGLT